MDPDKSSCFPGAATREVKENLLSFKQGELILADDDFLAFEVAKNENPIEDADWCGLPDNNPKYVGFSTITVSEGDILVFLKEAKVSFRKNYVEMFSELSKDGYALFWHIEKQTTFVYRCDCLDDVFRRLV
ncbi:MAG: hypothetical protein WC761_00320 [Candidatus Paceibacterota bacterium]|jgi:hypothetical protein